MEVRLETRGVRCAQRDVNPREQAAQPCLSLAPSGILWEPLPLSVGQAQILLADRMSPVPVAATSDIKDKAR